MSINVTVNGNPINIRRGRMVLSDLDQIKKNERDRRRRLRLEQVRQQSKEISNRLLERVKNLAKEELQKLEKDDKSGLKQAHDRKIMEIQQKYQEDMSDIGHAHTSAALESDLEANKQRTAASKAALKTALKRGKEAAKHVKEMQEKETSEQAHQERLRQVRDVENLRSSMIAKLPQRSIPETSASHGYTQQDLNEESDNEKSEKKRKTKKILSKKSPGKVTKSYVKVIGSDVKTHSLHLKSKSKTLKTASVKTGTSVQKDPLTDTPDVATSMTKGTAEEIEDVEHISESEHHEETPRKIVPPLNISSTKADKIARYNPEDYTQEPSSSDSSDSISDDSSYFSDSGEQPKCVRVPKHYNTPADSKVRLYDHSTRQRNLYDKPAGIVEKIDARNEPSAIDLAREVAQAESIESQSVESRKFSAQKRGEDALLREKVRRDYKELIKNLDQFASDERKLKASQVEPGLKDAYIREEQRKLLREYHKKRLNAALKFMLDQSPERSPPHLTERVITLPPRENDVCDNVPHGTWQEPCCSTLHSRIDKIQKHKSEKEKTSREEQILDMLKKVERQKRLLLQEFGADLPNDVFNASVKTLFETEKSVKPTQVQPEQRPLSPEIRVINMSSCDEDVTKRKVKVKGRSKSPVKKVEISVQTVPPSTADTAQDKSIQVELVAEKRNESNSSSTSVNVTTTKHYPIEPKVTVITPEADSSESRDSTVTAVTIDTDKQEVKVTPQKKRTSSKQSKRTPSKLFQKSRSMPVSKTSSPVKRFSKSLPSSRQSSPKKTNYSTADTPSKRIDIYVNKTGFNIKVEPSHVTKIAVDASTQSSQMHSMDMQQQSASAPYRIQSQSKRIIKLRDTSDTTSTSFASPPPIRPRDLLDALKNNTPILEMLDSSANETIRTFRRDISPVSTPETPSPRTMMMPSNIPHPDRISRILKYNSADSQTNESIMFSSTKNDPSTSTEPSDYQRHERVSSHRVSTRSKQSSISSRFCTCKNPQCQLMHTQFDDIHDYALKNCPQVLKKYEDLQNMCTERIASLTDLIEKVRNEQKGMDLSVMSPSDEANLMQLPSSKPTGNDLQSVRKLVESIEEIHNQLAKTLFESQRIIKNEVIVEEPENDKGIETDTLPFEISKNTTEYMEFKSEVKDTKAKPKIISEEKVNIKLDRFKMQHKPQTFITATTSDRNSRPSQKLNEEDTIEKLSKEILEQSKSLTKNSSISPVAKDINNSMKRLVQTSTNTNDFHTEMTEVNDTNDTPVKEENSRNETKKNNDFVPLLAGIPKVPRTGNNTSNSGRGKPPVTLLSAPYRTEIESSGHELSTIVEFDTPDTANKSQNNGKSSSPMKKATETQLSKSTTLKPSVHVAPLLTLQNQYLISGKSHEGSFAKPSSAIVSLHRSEESETIYDTPKTSKATENRGDLIKKNDAKRKDSVPEKSNKKLQCDTVTQDLLLHTEDLQPFSSVSSDPNNRYKNNKDKITSTSSNSFSGLSGISEITSTPSSDILKYGSSPEEMETALKKLGLGWAITTLKKTREASALSSSSNSDVTPINTARRMISPSKKQLDSKNRDLPDFSDVSSISIKEASKSTEHAVLLKGRTSTPKMQNSNSRSAETNSSSTNSSENFQEGSDSLIVPNVSLKNT